MPTGGPQAEGSPAGGPMGGLIPGEGAKMLWCSSAHRSGGGKSFITCWDGPQSLGMHLLIQQESGGLEPATSSDSCPAKPRASCSSSKWYPAMPVPLGNHENQVFPMQPPQTPNALFFNCGCFTIFSSIFLYSPELQRIQFICSSKT